MIKTMEELSIEQKASRYDEAIERAKDALNDGTISSNTIAYLQDIFPELQEGRGERIKNLIYCLIRDRSDNGKLLEHNGVSVEEALAWLEKKDEPSIYSVPSRNIILAVWELGNDWKELTKGRISTEHGTQLEYIQKHWNESEYHLREKQGEQKPADKVEPKFNFMVGQWIVATGKCVYLIAQIDGFNVTLVDTNGDEYVFDASSLNDAYQWTIADAKDGDVLSYNDGHGNDCIELIKSIVNKKIEFWFCLTNGEQYEVFDGIIPYTNLVSRECAIPATKEQRDLLFQKMKEAGYEWDAEKKELKKIEYEIEIPFGAKDSELQEVTYYIPKGFHAEIDDNKVVIKKGEKPITWSEEDENHIIGITMIIDCAVKRNVVSCKTGNMQIDWLKFLKERYTWKPSEKQIEALESATENCAYSEYQDCLRKLIGQLKKLKE